MFYFSATGFFACVYYTKYFFNLFVLPLIDFHVIFDSDFIIQFFLGSHISFIKCEWHLIVRIAHPEGLRRLNDFLCVEISSLFWQNFPLICFSWFSILNSIISKTYILRIEHQKVSISDIKRNHKPNK